MSESTFYFFVLVWTAIAFLIAPTLLKRTQPYGRHYNSDSGRAINDRTGWLIMGLVSPVVFSYFFLDGEQARTYVTWVFFWLWNIHYGYRSLIYPFLLKTNRKKIPLMVVLSAILFNLVNGFINGFYLGDIGPAYALSWFKTSEFIGGMVLFISGFLLNLYSDNILLRFRKKDDTGYVIPQGGFFRFVSCPNYLGEIIEWGGFALMTQSLPALSFFIWTVCNLVPRALANHKWYLNQFENYPQNRRAIIPFIL